MRRSAGSEPRRTQRSRPSERVERALEREPGAPAEALGRPWEETGTRCVGVSDFPHLQEGNEPSCRADTPPRQLHSVAVSAQVTVLVVDDDPSIRLLCRVNLQLDGYVVTEAGTLDEARTAIAEQQPDLVILDVHIPGGDGRELLAELRAERPELPVALLTGSAAREDLLRAGADALIPKPFTLVELRETVRRLAGGR